MCTMEGRLPRNNLSFSIPTTYTLPPVSHPTSSVTWLSSSDPSSTPFLTGPLSVSTAPSSGVNQHQQNQTYHFGFEDAPFVNIPADSLHNDHSDPYVPSEGDVESDDSERASQISNSEVRSSNIIISCQWMFVHHFAACK